MNFTVPKNFLWGASTSSYQTEGGNVNCDWYQWEQEKNWPACGQACDHYRLYPEDIRLAKRLNLNSLRISLEWSRLYPKHKQFDMAALEHYRQVLATMRAAGITPIVTLHHFTNPIWFMRKGGWTKAANIEYFSEYVCTVVKALKEYCSFWIVFNEPMVYVYNGYTTGYWPPGGRSIRDVYRVMDNITRAYIRAYDDIKAIYTFSRLDPAQISIAKHMRAFLPCRKNNPIDAFFAKFRDRNFNLAFLAPLAKAGKLDFIGLNYYCKEYVKGGALYGRSCERDHHIERKNALGWNISPESFYDLLMRLSWFELPVVITENGTAEKYNDHYRDFLLGHLKAMAAAMRKGVDIRGYFWWSLIDNFEWHQGFGPCFGLYSVNYKNYARTPRPFSSVYARIAQEGAIKI